MKPNTKNSSDTPPQKRLNRVRIEWSAFLSPTEYMVLDKMLFQSNLTKANDGDGFHFHVRQLARELNVARSYLSDTLKRWPFIRRQGSTKAMVITLDYAECMKWIEGLLSRGNNDCPPDANDCPPSVNDCPPRRTMIVRPGEPISNREESTRESTKKDVSEMTSTGGATLMDMEQLLDNGFYSKSEYPSIVSGPVIKVSKKRFSVPYGMDDKTTKPANDWDGIKSAYTETVLEWERQHVPAEVKRRRIDAFKVQADNVHSALDVIKVFKGITDTEGK